MAEWFDQALAQYVRDVVVDLKRLLSRVAAVATKQLISAITCEQGVDAVVACAHRAVVGGYGRGVSKGFVIGGSYMGNGIDDVVRGDVVFMMIGGEFCGDELFGGNSRYATQKAFE